MDVIEGGPRFESAPDNQPQTPVEQAPTQEPIEVEGSTEGQPVEASPPEKQPYTLEELQELNRIGGKVDTSRLPDFLQPIYKQFQGDYTRDKQALAEERKQLAQAWQEIQTRFQKPQTPSVIEEFDRNPQAVLQRLDQAYQEKAESDPFEAQKILFVRTQLQDRLIGKLAQGFQQDKSEAHGEAVRVAAFQQAKSNIPEYDETLRNNLAEFAVNDLGYELAEIERMTDPAFLMSLGYPPQKAVKLANANLKSVYNQYKAKVGAANIRRNTPTRVESAGTGFPSQDSKWNTDKALAEREKNVLT